LVARNNLLKRVAIAGQAGANQFCIVFGRWRRYLICHHINHNVAKMRLNVTGFFTSDKPGFAAP
jgi:hypothetical protein